MNASARAIAAGTFTTHNLRQMLFTTPNIAVGLLLLALLITSFAVIYVKDMNRREFIELHNLQHQHDEMLIEQGKLLLEQNTWSSPIRIQGLAQNELNLSNPTKNPIVFIK
jgi:cell division protein FtsL